MQQRRSEQVYCLIRKEWVAALPEEIIRQRLLHQMIHFLGYPASGLAIEKPLQHVPHIAFQGKQLPLRRADIICFSNGIHPSHALYPLLLVECKAVKLTSKVISQITGYNHFLQAYYVCIANQKEVRTGRYNKNIENYSFIDRLPSYQELIQSLFTQ